MYYMLYQNWLFRAFFPPKDKLSTVFLLTVSAIHLCFIIAGLGEMMPSQLWETTMNPEQRLLKQLVVEDAAEANVVFSSLMGTRVSNINSCYHILLSDLFNL